jgi:hypothetical protein
VRANTGSIRIRLPDSDLNGRTTSGAFLLVSLSWKVSENIFGDKKSITEKCPWRKRLKSCWDKITILKRKLRNDQIFKDFNITVGFLPTGRQAANGSFKPSTKETV